MATLQKALHQNELSGRDLSIIQPYVVLVQSGIKNLYVRTEPTNFPLPYGSRHTLCRFNAEVCFDRHDVYGGA